MATQVISLYGKVTLVDNMSAPLNRIMHNTRSWKTGVLGAMAAVTAAVGGLGVASVKAATTFESSFTGVRKTVNATEEEFQALRQGILDMAKDATNPVAGLPNAQNALAGIMEQAGQLGIRGVDNLLKFTETVAKLEMSTNLGADAAIRMAQFLNITGEPTQNIDKVASAIVRLGNNLATTELDVMNMSFRIAGAGTVAGLSTDQILGLAGAASSLGLRAEMGGSAIAMMFNQMAEAIGRGSEELDAFAEVAGMSSGQFSNLFRRDALKAWAAVVEGISNLDATQQAEALDNIGLSGIRVSDAMRRLALDIEGVGEATSMAADAMESANDHNIEAQRRFETTAAQWNLLKNTIRDVAITIGDRLLPALNIVIGTVQQFLVGDAFTSFLNNVLDRGAAAAVVIGSIASAIGGGLLSSIDNIGQSLSGPAASVMAFLFGADAPMVNTSNILGPLVAGGAVSGVQGSDATVGSLAPLLRPDLRSPLQGATRGILPSISDIQSFLFGRDPNMIDSSALLGPLVAGGAVRGTQGRHATTGSISPIFGDGSLGDVNFDQGQQGFIDKLIDLKDNVMPHIVSAFNTLKNDIIPALVSAFTTLKDDIIPTLLGHFNTFKEDILPEIVAFIKPKLKSALEEAKAIWVDDIVPAFETVRNEVIPRIVEIFETRVIPAIRDIRDTWDEIKKRFEETRDFVSDRLNSAFATIRDIWVQLRDEILPPIIDKLKKDWKPIFEDVRDILDRWVIIFTEEIWPFFRDELIPALTNDVLPVFVNIAKLYLPIAGALLLGIYEIIVLAAEQLVRWADQGTSVVEWLIAANRETGFLRTAFDGIKGVVDGLLESIRLVADALGMLQSVLGLGGSDPMAYTKSRLGYVRAEGDALLRNTGLTSSSYGSSGVVLDKYLRSGGGRNQPVPYTSGGGTTTWGGMRHSGGVGFPGQSYGVIPGEMFTPSTMGHFTPPGRGESGNTFNVTINAETYEGGQEAARGFMDYAAQRGLNLTGLTG